MLLSIIITNYGDFPEECQEMFLKQKYVNNGTNRAEKSRGAHQSTYRSKALYLQSGTGGRHQIEVQLRHLC